MRLYTARYRRMSARLRPASTKFRRRAVRQALAIVVVFAGTTSHVFAQGLDLTLFLGRAFPVYDERLTFAPVLPALPRTSVTEVGQLEIVTEGGRVFGGALAVEVGLLAIEGRLDATDIGFRVNGTRYELRTTVPFVSPIGSVTIGAGRLDAKRLNLMSLNLRLRTPGPIGLVASGGLSYLPGVTIEGSVPVTVELTSMPPVIDANARLALIAAPDQARHRWGLNGGAGLRIGGGRAALLVEARAFYFRDFELRFERAEGPDLLNAIVTGISVVRFEPVIVNAQAGVTFRF